jgi:hypothetical protein
LTGLDNVQETIKAFPHAWQSSTPVSIHFNPMPTSIESSRVGQISAPTPIIEPPTIVYREDPLNFINSFFNTITNNYGIAWNMQTEEFRNRRNKDGYVQFERFWKQVDTVTIDQAEVLEKNPSKSIIRVHLTYNLKGGRVIDVGYIEYTIISNPQNNSWLISDSSWKE